MSREPFDTLAAAFFDDEVESTPAYVRGVLPDAQLRERVGAYVRKNFDLVTDREFARRYYENVRIPHTAPQDYNYQVVPLRGGRVVLASIRFKGLDLGKPFVELVHKNFPIERPSDVEDIRKALAERYRVFAPREIRIFSADPDLLGQRAGVDLACDFRYYGAPVRDVVSPGAPQPEVSISVERETTLDVYDRCHQIYRELSETSAVHGPGEVWLESKETLLGALEERTLFSAYVGGEWAGLFALRRDAERFLKGFLVLEAVLAKAFRGRGLAPHAYRKVFESLDRTEGDFLYGHIRDDNLASVRTALRVGRRPLGGCFFLSM